MPYQVKWEPRGVYSRYYGNVTGEDMRRHIEEVCKDDRFEQHRYNILDFSDATEFSPTERELLINSGVLIGAAFTNHQVLDCRGSHAGECQGGTASDSMRSACPPTLRRYFQP